MTQPPPALVLSRRLSASCAAAFRAWSDPELIRRWLAPGPNVVERAETDFRLGGGFLLETKAPDGARHRITGLYRVIERHRRIVQSWIYEGPADLLNGIETELEIAFEPIDDDACELTLTHRLLARDDVRDAYRSDWPTCLAKLDRALNRP